MALIAVNNKDIQTGFFLNSLFSALTFSFLFVFNQVITDLIDRYKVSKKWKRYLSRLGLHFLIIIILTFLLSHVFKYVFGWGGLFLSDNI